VALVTATALIAGACTTTDEVEGTVRVTGSSTLRPILSVVAGRYATEQPFVNIDLDTPGTADGFTLFCDGLADITGASRPMNEREQEACRSSGVDWIELIVGYDAIVAFTPTTDPPIECLTTAQLYALGGPESQGRRTWGSTASLAEDVSAGDGAPLAALGERPLTFVGPGIESGTRAAFIDLAIAPIAESRGKAAALRADTRSPTGASVIINEVASTGGALGILGLAALAGTESVVRPVALNDGQGCIFPNLESVSAGTYPLTRELSVYVARSRDGSIPPAALGFVGYLLSDQGFDLASEAGALRLDDQRINAVRAQWSDASAAAN
jgi:phosphate transport system substrate-binding protein